LVIRKAPTLAFLALSVLAFSPRAAPADSAASLSPKLSAAEKAATARITASEISGHTRFLSDDLLEGRFPGTRGDEIAIRYLATELETMGFRPAAIDVEGKSSWFQQVPLVRHTASVPPEVVFRAGTRQLALSTRAGPRADIVLRSMGNTDRVVAKDAELVFVGYGIVAPEHGWDDYRGLDVKGKIVVMLNFNPPWAGKGVRLWYGRWDYKYLEAARRGAIGALLIHTTESASYPWQVVATSNVPVSFGFPADQDPDPQLAFQGWISHDAAVRVFTLAGRDLSRDEAAATDPTGKGGPSTSLGVTASLEMPVLRERIETSNVVGILPGSDPKLSDEVVLYTAHHDHLGTRNPPVSGERNVYAGAVDNASGCGTVLTIAHALVASPPKRSVVVAFVAAEEQGLLGSHWYAAHPTVKPGRIAAVINIDGINFHGRTLDVGFLGFGKSSLDGIVAALAAAQGRKVHGDPFPDRGSFYRSDDFELARVGVPTVRVKGGPKYVGRPEGWGKEQSDLYVRRDYHQPSDVYPASPASWDLTGAVEDARLQLAVGLRIGNDPQLPRWTPGDEFERARLTAPR
jgi:Zn-dependent M28 family amino/carboxypeptidase